jgi:hypothetical protein
MEKVTRTRIRWNYLVSESPLVRPKFCVTTVAKEKPATCQNQTLVKSKPKTKTNRPVKEMARATKAIREARQYATP